MTLTHLKQPAGEVGPLDVHHDHGHGRSTLPGAVDLLDLAARGVTVTEAAEAIYDTASPNRNQRERVRRRLDKLHSAGKVRREPGQQGEPVTYWLACVTPRAGSRDPLTHPRTQGHDLALQAATHPHTQSFGTNGTPFKGGREVNRDPHHDAELQARADDLEARHSEAAV